MAKLSPTQLETFTYGAPGWVHVYNANIERLNDLLLKLGALQDVDMSNAKDGAILRWNEAGQKWVLAELRGEPPPA